MLFQFHILGNPLDIFLRKNRTGGFTAIPVTIEVNVFPALAQYQGVVAV
jgi:hypothetical protein